MENSKICYTICSTDEANLLPLPPSTAVVRSFDVATNSQGMATALGYPFTWAQWKELERQAMIYKYMVSAMSVPPDLLLSISSEASHTTCNSRLFSVVFVFFIYLPVIDGVFGCSGYWISTRPAIHNKYKGSRARKMQKNGRQKLEMLSRCSSS